MRKKRKVACGRYLFFLGVIRYVLLIGIISCIPAMLVITRESEMKNQMSSFTGVFVSFEGRIASESTSKHTYDTVEVVLTKPIVIDENKLNAKGHKILIKIKKYEKYNIGEVCNISGKFKLPENYEDFAYQDYLINNNIYLVMEFPQIICNGKRKGIVIQNWLIDSKEKLNKIVSDNLNEPQSSLLMGVLFGQDRLFSKSFDENIRIAGVSHIVAASGYNITVLLIAGGKIFRFLSLKIKTCLLLLVIWMFCIFSGLSPSILRACIMTSISLIAIMFGRKNSVNVALPLATCIFAIFEPKIVFNVGFQLSVVATTGLIYLCPALSNISEKICKKKVDFLENVLFPTLSCTLATLPITIYTFKTMTVWSIVANCLILPVIETTMLLGILAIFLSQVSFLIGTFLFEIINVQLKYFELVVNLIGETAGGYWEFQAVPLLAPIAILVILIIICIYFYPVENETHNYYLKIFNQ